jgi:hypothetical protein
MANHDIQEDDCKLDSLELRAEGIVRDLANAARTAARRGYGTTQLIFSDCSFVSRTESEKISRVESLLRARHKPLGCIAPDRERKRNPFIEVWEMDDKSAVAELRAVAHQAFWHLLPERNAQRQLPAQARSTSTKTVAAASTPTVTVQGKKENQDDE